MENSGLGGEKHQEKDVGVAQEVQQDRKSGSCSRSGGVRLTLDSPVRYVPGIGPKLSEALARYLNVRTVRDLLYLLPARYVDRSQWWTVAQVRQLARKNTGEAVQFLGRVVQRRLIPLGKRRKQTILEVVVEDEAGGRLSLFWLHATMWYYKKLVVGSWWVIHGKPTYFLSRPAILHPDLTDPQERREGLQTVYTLPRSLVRRGLSLRRLKQIYQTIFNQLLPPDRIPDPLPAWIRQERKLLPLGVALKNLHFPSSSEAFSEAMRRLKYDELFSLQIVLVQEKLLRQRTQKGIAIPHSGNLIHQFYRERLSFALTEDQKRAVHEIYQDFRRGVPMRRLLQGDVGSGKTVVALLSALLMVDHGYQVCLMAPTEVLAYQHWQKWRAWLHGLRTSDGSAIQVHLLTGSVRGTRRRQLLQMLKDGNIHILIGTHALIEDPVQFARLGYVIIDEQHRFGVLQRARLVFKNEALTPHVLVMSATPIPRTLALTIYGDLDVSVLKTLPPGRKPVKTFHLYESHREEAYRFIRQELNRGRQAYIVFPLIEESETMDYANLEEGIRRIEAFFGKDYPFVVLHGRMKPEEKQEAMDAFTSGRAPLMVATNVIEVGVDVPRATTIVIESAERFGLAQLHQLRGRVCRSSDQPYCFLVTARRLSADALKRIQAMLTTTDGFQLAELDLQLRGPGELLGVQQSGMINLRFASLVHDQQLLQDARKDAIRLLQEDYQLRRYPALRKTIRDVWGDRLPLGKVG